MAELHTLSLSELSAGLRRKEYSSRELTQAYLGRIERLDGRLNSFITLNEGALEEANSADGLLAAGDGGRLTGIPIGVKDIFCTKGLPTTCASKMLSNFVSPYDATVVDRLKRAGTVLLGKNNMDEFAMGSSNENSAFQPCRNPWDQERVPGGSSGGSACAVAARLAAGSIGTDTGGSIRQPAAFCGVTGIKPTYGRVSRFGMIAFASSLDQGGVLTQNAEDAALLLSAMMGFDPRDSTSLQHPEEDLAEGLTQSIKGLKIGIPKQYFGEGLQHAVAASVHNALRELEKLGAHCVDVDLPHSKLAIPAYYVIAPAEASSNLSRYDGVRFGHRCDAPVDLDDLYCRSRQEGFGPEVKRRIMIGTYTLSAGYYDAYYIKAQQIRRLIRDEFIEALDKVDVIAGPTAPSTAFPLGSRTTDPITMYMSDIYTIAANLAGLPALSVPVGFDGNLPTAMQLIGNYLQEGRLLNIAHQYQQVSDWHRRIALPGS